MTVAFVLIGSLFVFCSGLLLLAWSAEWSPQRIVVRVRPRFVEWVGLAVDQHRRQQISVAEVEEVTRMATKVLLNEPDR